MNFTENIVILRVTEDGLSLFNCPLVELENISNLFWIKKMLHRINTIDMLVIKHTTSTWPLSYQERNTTNESEKKRRNRNQEKHGHKVYVKI